MRINTNVASMTALEANKNTNSNLTKSLEKLSSGLKINKAADDASGLSIADKLRTQASSINQGIANANSAVALLQIADKAMAEQSNILDIVKQKLIQASTSTTSADGREAVRKDINKLLEQLDMIAAQTNYNGTTLLQKSKDSTSKQEDFTFQLGEFSAFDVTASPTNASNTANLGGGADTVATGTNIAQDGSLSVKAGDGNPIVLSSVDLDATDADTTGTLALNVSVSGIIGQVSSSADLTLDLSSAPQTLRDAVANQALTDGAITAGANNTFTITSGTDFGSLNFSGAKFIGDADVETISFTTAEEVMITNNYTTTTSGGVDHGLLEVRNADMTGGQLLRDILNVSKDNLTIDLANAFMTTVDQAITQLNTTRADFGASQNQIESSIRSMQTTHTNLKNAESVIRDVDYAAESANFNKQNIISQAGTYAVSQANNVQQNVLKLLQ